MLTRAYVTMAVGGALLCCSNPARADWEYTKWGMTRQEVIEAGEGKVRPLPRPKNAYGGNVTALSARFEDAQFQYTASFTFNRNGGLAWVSLEQKDTSRCPALLEALEQMYGRAADDEGGSLWLDRNGGNKIRFLQLATVAGCEVTYHPLNA